MAQEISVTPAASQVIGVSRSPLFTLPGEIRNKIYDHLFGDKTLQVLPQFTGSRRSFTPPLATGEILLRPTTDVVVWRSTKNRGLYNVRQTCRCIAAETEHYLFQTMDFSDRHSVQCMSSGDLDQAPHHELFERMLQGRWKHVRHLMVCGRYVGVMLKTTEDHVPNFPMPTLTDTYFEKWRRIIWPKDGRYLTTLTINDMRPGCEKLIKVLMYYFPKLEDVRCVHYHATEYTERYRLVDGELKYWYTGELYKILPAEPTWEQWFYGHGNARGPESWSWSWDKKK